MGFQPVRIGSVRTSAPRDSRHGMESHATCTAPSEADDNDRSVLNRLLKIEVSARHPEREFHDRIHEEVQETILGRTNLILAIRRSQIRELLHF